MKPSQLVVRLLLSNQKLGTRMGGGDNEMCCSLSMLLFTICIGYTNTDRKEDLLTSPSPPFLPSSEVTSSQPITSHLNDTTEDMEDGGVAIESFTQPSRFDELIIGTQIPCTPGASQVISHHPLCSWLGICSLVPRLFSHKQGMERAW